MAETGREGLAETARAALGMFADTVRLTYGDRLKWLVAFGRRSRRDASRDRDLDVAVILGGDVDQYGEK